ncbi:hypothetical protein [Saccharicrinis aurantiacus]|uniref:hypothetical protein n=1 Tax=Saccharicrinis aurantiacus TaxID=1849719 RepID=UPI00111548A1|nr:hypothetical protein [Saccharicrinis aurantiacus]
MHKMFGVFEIELWCLVPFGLSLSRTWVVARSDLPRVYRANKHPINTRSGPNDAPTEVRPSLNAISNRK